MKLEFVGVRFINNPHRIWTYQVVKSAKPRHGDLYVVENDHGTKVVIVVSVGRKPDNYDGPFKQITQKVISV